MNFLLLILAVIGTSSGWLYSFYRKREIQKFAPEAEKFKEARKEDKTLIQLFYGDKVVDWKFANFDAQRGKYIVDEDMEIPAKGNAIYNHKGLRIGYAINNLPKLVEPMAATVSEAMDMNLNLPLEESGMKAPEVLSIIPTEIFDDDKFKEEGEIVHNPFLVPMHKVSEFQGFNENSQNYSEMRYWEKLKDQVGDSFWDSLANFFTKKRLALFVPIIVAIGIAYFIFSSAGGLEPITKALPL